MRLSIPRPRQRGGIAPEWVQQQYTISLVACCVLVIIFHPAFHFALNRLPDVPPDSLATRMVAVAYSAAALLAVLFAPRLRRHSAELQVLNAGLAVIVTHILVLDSGNHPMYLAASVTTIYAAQLSFVRLREWGATVALVALWMAYDLSRRPPEATAANDFALLFHISNYTIATLLVAVREQIQRREWQARQALQSANTRLQAATEQLQSDLELARAIQQSLLPPARPAWRHYDLVCYSRPAREVGGDFYSYYHFGPTHVALAVGDVSGKGVPAALLMAASVSLLNSSSSQAEPPPSHLAQLDTQLMPYTQPQRQHCALCYVELTDLRACIVNAGGVPPYVRRVGGTVEFPEAWGFALGYGLGAQHGYQSQHLDLAPGDVVVLVSDGVIEARDAAGELYSFDRMARAVGAGPTQSAQAMVDHLLADLARFSGDVEPHDDITVVVLRVVAG